MRDERTYAEDLNYWKTGASSPDAWIEKAKREIGAAGGSVLGEAFGQDSQGRAAYMLAFRAGGEQFKAVWPVLESSSGDEKAARRQAATMLFHDIKSRCVAARVLGPRAAFFSYLMLPDGRTASQLAVPELTAAVPQILLGGNDQPRLNQEG